MTALLTPPPEAKFFTPGAGDAVLLVDPKTVTRCAGARKIGSIRTPGGHHTSRRSLEALRDGDRAALAEATGRLASNGPGGGELPPVSIRPSVLQQAILTTTGASAAAVMAQVVARATAKAVRPPSQPATCR